MNSELGSSKNDAQREKIVQEKNDLYKQLIVLIILSLLISGAFYGITMLQNPFMKA
jgi:hypothetical protein